MIYGSVFKLDDECMCFFSVALLLQREKEQKPHKDWVGAIFFFFRKNKDK